MWLWEFRSFLSLFSLREYKTASRGCGQILKAHHHFRAGFIFFGYQSPSISNNYWVATPRASLAISTFDFELRMPRTCTYFCPVVHKFWTRTRITHIRHARDTTGLFDEKENNTGYINNRKTKEAKTKKKSNR